MTLRDAGATVLSVFGILFAILGAKVIAFEPGTELCLHSPVKNVRFHVENADYFGGVHQLTVQSHADEVFNKGYYLETGQTLYVKFSRHDQLKGIHKRGRRRPRRFQSPRDLEGTWYKSCF